MYLSPYKWIIIFAVMVALTVRLSFTVSKRWGVA